MKHVILDQPLRVDSREYLHLGEPIGALDEVVSSAASLTFTLEYPFDKPYAGMVAGARGITRRAVIDAIRAGFQTMYGADRAYGRAHQALDHLFIDRVVLDGHALAVEITT